eukprot:s549_g2.t1
MNLHWNQTRTWHQGNDVQSCAADDESEHAFQADRDYNHDSDQLPVWVTASYVSSSGSLTKNFVPEFATSCGQCDAFSLDDSSQRSIDDFSTETTLEFEPSVFAVGSSSDHVSESSKMRRKCIQDESDDAVRIFQSALQQTLQTFEQEYAWTASVVPRKLQCGNADVSCSQQNVTSNREMETSSFRRFLPHVRHDDCVERDDQDDLHLSPDIRNDARTSAGAECTELFSWVRFAQDVEPSEIAVFPADLPTWKVENHMDDISVLPAISIHAHSEMESCEGSFQLIQKRRCRFDETVEVICVQDHNVCSFTVQESDKEVFLRSFWHLDGQIASWHEIQNSIFRAQVDGFAMTVVGNAQFMSQSDQTSSFSDCTSIPNTLHENQIRSPQFHRDTDEWWKTLLEESSDGRRKGRKLNVMTWFVSKDRFHVSLVPRPVPFTDAVLVNDFASQCRSIWSDLDDGRDISFHVVQPSPVGLPSTLKHVILIQGEYQGRVAALYYGHTLPVLRRTRAVLFPFGATVEQFFRVAQHPEACQGHDTMCFVRYQHHGAEVRFSAMQSIHPPFATVLEGDIRVLMPEHNPEFDDELNSDDLSATDTNLPDGELSDDSDETGFVSGGPQFYQLDDDDPYPWQTFHLHEPEPQEIQQEEPTPDIQFAPQHEGFLQDAIEQLMNLEEEDETPWLAATFGALGRRDIHFQPHDLQSLVADILQAWADHAAYGDLILYNVHPQPLDKIGQRAVAILAVVDLPESMDESVRHVLVVEQTEGEIFARDQPYGARVTSETSDRELLAHLGLHVHCAPFALRNCRVRLGEIFMQAKTFYEFEHGTLCRTWITNTYPQVAEAEQHIVDVDRFFLQVLSLTEAEHAPLNIVCRLHGISPENIPMGARDVILPTEWIYDLAWIDEFQAIWPFADENLQISFVSTLTADMEETGAPVFHFIVKCGLEHGTPILVQQQIIPVDHTIQFTNGANELWAISVPAGEANVGVVQALFGWPFWFRYCREQNVYPHLSRNGDRLIEVRDIWRPGDLLRARFMVWDRSHVLMLMLGSVPNPFPVEPEATSFLQVDAKQRTLQLQDTASHSNDVHNDLPTLRNRWGANLDPPGFQGLPKDRVMGKTLENQPPTWWTYATARQHSPSNDCQSSLREGLGGNVDPFDSQSHEFSARVWEGQEDNADLLHSSSVDQSFCNQRTSHHDDELQQLQLCIQQILRRNDVGINLDLTQIPSLHPFAQAACAMTEQYVGVAHHSRNRFHIFTDGSCKKHRASWAFTVVCEQQCGQHVNFLRVGYAAGLVDDSIGLAEQTSQDAEATALAAAAEYVLSRDFLPNMDIHLHFDAMSVGQGSTGHTAVIQQNPEISTRQRAARVLVHLAQRKFDDFRGFHVHAHQGNPWNEMSDSLARAVREGWSPEKTFQWSSGPLFNQRLHHWAWMLVRPTQELPDIGTILQNESPSGFAGKIDHTLIQRPNGEPEAASSFTVRLATANVGTLDPGQQDNHSASFKTVEILRQMEEHGIHIAAIHRKDEQERVEIWINGDAISQLTQGSFRPLEDVCVWYEDHRVLAARFHIQNLTFEVITAYAPQKGRSDAEIQEWWRHLHNIMSQKDPNAACFLLGDLNCKIGSIVSEEIGPFGADMEDTGGECMRDLCSDFQLIVPSTWDQFHTGQHWTFTSSHGTHSRLDYIAVSKCCAASIRQSYVDDHLDLLNGARDHSVLVLEIGLVMEKDQQHRFIRKPLYDRDAARAAKQEKQESPLQSLPECEWSMDVNHHWSQIREHVQHEMTARFPLQKRQKRQLYFSERTWQILCHKKDLRQEHRSIQRAQRFSVMKFFFHAWRNVETTQDDVETFNMAQHLLSQQDVLLWQACQRLNHDFKISKKKEWKAWVNRQLEDKIARLRFAKASDLYKILKPKKIIDKKKGANQKPLPGMKDQFGQWRRSRADIALAWDVQFSAIELAEEVTFEDLMQRSQAVSGPWSANDLMDIPSFYDLERSLRGLNTNKAGGLDGLGAEVWQLGTSADIERVFAVLLKAAIRQQSMPGDPCADILFGYVMAQMLDTIIQRTKDVGIHLCQDQVGGTTASYVTWVDDLALGIQEDASKLAASVTTVLSILIDVTTEHGLELSYGKGKTAVLMDFRGKQKTQSRQSFEKSCPEAIPVLSEHWGPINVPVLGFYRHLGGLVVPNGSLLPEIKARGKNMLQNIAPLKSLLINASIDIDKRRTLLKSLGLSVARLHSGTWFNLTQADAMAWQAVLYKAYHLLEKRAENGLYEHKQLLELACQSKGPMPMEMLYIERIRLLIHLLQVQDSFVITAILHNHEIAGKQSWLYGVIMALKWAQTQIGEQGVPNELLDLTNRDTWSIFHEVSHDLKKMLKAVEKAHQIRLRTFEVLKQQGMFQEQVFREMGWTQTETHERAEENDDDGSSVRCDQCQAVFGSPAALATHQQRKHDQRIALRRLTGDSVCRSCNKQFHTRVRLLGHLHRGNTPCWIFHMRRYVPMDEESAAALDREDRAKGQAFHQVAAVSEQAPKGWRWATEEELIPCLPVRPYEGDILDDPTDSEILQWGSLGMLPPGRGGREKTERTSKPMEINNVMKAISDLERGFLQQVHRWQANYDWVPRPLSHGQLFVLVLFSGHRRLNDISSWLHWRGTVTPIAVDLAVSAEHGDILQSDKWEHLIRSRRVAGAHGAPPCETFSLARWIPIPDQPSPQPLRSRAQPWGREGLSLRETSQCFTGTLLMMKTLRLLLLVYLHGGSVSLEHPKGEWDHAEKWCIWLAGLVRWLLLGPELELCTFLQGPLGQVSAKPTTLLLGRLMQIPAKIFGRYDLSWRPKGQLMGKDADGWRTAKAKVYPSKLCQCIAEGHAEHAERVSREGFDPLPDNMTDTLTALTAVLDPYHADFHMHHMMTDFHRRNLSCI